MRVANIFVFYFTNHRFTEYQGFSIVICNIFGDSGYIWAEVQLDLFVTMRIKSRMSTYRFEQEAMAATIRSCCRVVPCSEIMIEEFVKIICQKSNLSEVTI